VVVPVSLPTITALALAPLLSPLLCLGTICIVFSAPAVMCVMPSSPAVTSIFVPVTVAVMPPGVRVEAVPYPVLPGIRCLLLTPFRVPARFVAILALHHKGPVHVSLHVGMQVEGGGHSEAFFGIKLTEQGLTAGPYVVSPQLAGPLLPH